MSERDYPVKHYVIALCSACVEQKGQQCHTPGCAFIRRNVAEEGWPLRNGSEFDRHLFPTLEEYREDASSPDALRAAFDKGARAAYARSADAARCGVRTGEKDETADRYYEGYCDGRLAAELAIRALSPEGLPGRPA